MQPRSFNPFRTYLLPALIALLLPGLLACGQLDPEENGQASGTPGADRAAALLPVDDDAAVLHHVAASSQPVVVENDMELMRSQDDGVIRSFAWRQVHGPAVAIEDTTDESLEFTPPAPDTYVFEVVVTDNQGAQVVVDRRAIVVHAAGADTQRAVRCAVALLPDGTETDREALARLPWTSWNACPGAEIRFGSDLDGDGAPDLPMGTLTLVKEVDKSTPLLYQGLRDPDDDGDGYADVRVHSVGIGKEEVILGMEEERAADRSMGRLKTGDVTLERPYHATSPRPDIFALAQKAARNPSVHGDILLEQDETFTVALHDTNGTGGTQVTLSHCKATGYEPFVIDGIALEPVERLSLRCERAEVKAEGTGKALYAWISAGLHGEAKPGTLVIKEVLPDGSDGRIFVSTGAFPKEWTLPARAGSPLYEDSGLTGTNPLYESQAATGTLGLEKITLAVENMYQE